MWKFSGLTWKDLSNRVLSEIQEDDVFGRSAQLAYYFLLAFALIYYLAPDLHEQKWAWVTPGSVVGVGLWLLVSFGFKLYLHFFDSYSKTYGTLGAVIVLMLWLYLTGAAILVGGEVNSEIENAAAKDGDPDTKEKGEKAPSEKDRNGSLQNSRHGAARV